MRRLLFSLLVLAIAGTARAQDAAPPEQLVVVVVGAEGSEEYGEMFREWAANWQQACETGGAMCETIGLDESEGEPTDRERLEKLLAKGDALAARQLWIVLIGHGTFDGKVAKFNLRGPDIAASELGDWLKQVTLPTAVVNTSSSSAPFLQALSGENRLVVTATKSGHESNFARLGGPLSEAIADPSADLDKDGQVSLLEAWLTASREVAEFYESDARLATEHSLLDDNGDKLGTPADWFRGIRATRRAKPGSALDGLRAHQFHLIPSAREASLTAEQRDRRDELERGIESLREEKETLGEEVYYEQLEKLLLELAEVYEVTKEQSDVDAASAP